MFGNHAPGIGEPVRGLNGIDPDALGSLPATFADQLIKFRIPYTMAGELVTGADTTAVQFNEATFLHTIDKPFEVHQMHIELTGLAADNSIPDTQPLTLDRLVRLRMEDTAKNEKITKNPTLVSVMRDALTHLWCWEVPYTFTRQEGFTISVDTDDLPTICVPNATCDASDPLIITQVRTEISFQGYLIVIRPASDMR